MTDTRENEGLAQAGASQTDLTYPIDTEQVDELARLIQQDRLVNEAMGGLFPEGQTLPEGGRLLDLACGPGGWACEVAFQHPSVEVIGVDISPSTVEYANTYARSRGLSNVQFQVMNVMEPLAFPDASFDLINGRALFSFMQPQDWRHLLAECRRLLKPGGIIRLTESEFPLTSSPATERYFALIAAALKRAGQSFSPDGRHVGITPVLPRLLRQAGFQDVHLRAGAVEWSSEAPMHYAFFKDLFVLFQLIQPFLLKTGVISREELEPLYQQTIAEMQADDFYAIATGLTVWGQQPHASA
ncbi:MAG: methyltransferase domain-containing protein [Thermogemmatispora sp.]|uniref:class I SAM-dependent methyltransferase n=1 Tax=Thermogemmatispora sp. TaxID=1968838 RepID=UPI0019ED1F97|nr:class I SAM-dependent methyltransferase [Thermogemmatispora sp.]MBE3568328.1 methyltransferase domain-containing protein [Thermogemmatispora sp.]